MQTERLVYMANQIGKYFSAQGEEQAIANIADHLKKFWDPRMRSQIIAYAQSGGEGLDPDVAAAIATLAANSASTKKSA